MKPIYLKLCGINSFSEPAEINFEALLDQGIFGIFGDTGSGKSTILDAIGFALYGSVSRDGNSADIINFRCDRGNVVFIFEIYYQNARRTYRIEREIRRKKDGLTTQSLFVYEETGGRLVTVAEGVNKGNAFLLGVIGLKQDDFEKCIALPQGEFARFIKEAPRERLEIVSRLFDLERFGGNLFRRASNRSVMLMRDCDVLSARLEQYAEVSKERLQAITEEIASRTAADAESRAALDAKRTEEKRVHAVVERRRELDSLALRRAALDAKREEMATLERELGRLEAARAVLSAEREYTDCNKLFLEAERRFSYCKRRAEETASALASLPAFDEEKADREIEALTLARGKAELRARTESEKQAAERELAAATEQLSALQQRTVDPDYENRLKELLALQERTGAGDLYAFVEAKRDALFRGEYGRFASEIKELEEKYPLISPDSTPLLTRYTALSEGERLDFSDLKAAFEARERAKKASEQARLDLENAQNSYLRNRERLDALLERISSLKEKLAACDAQIADAPDLKTIEKELLERKSARESFLSARARTERERNASELELASSKAEESARRDALGKAEARLQDSLQGFGSVEEARALLSRFGDAADARARLTEYHHAVAAVFSRYEELKSADDPSATEESLHFLRQEIATLESALAESAGRLAVLRENQQRITGMLAEKETLETEYGRKQRESEVAQRLTNLLRGGKFMEYVAEEYLQTVAVNASFRLLSLTGGRYFLRYGNGAFSVGDNFNGGELRSVGTLSGGETFLVSLSLALSLSAEICAKSARPIEFFFLDEGFGTLDEKLVDTVMDSLEKLRSKNFSIGIISHVEELKHRIDRKLFVTKATEEHGSRISAE